MLSHMQNLAKKNVCTCGTLKHEEKRTRKDKHKRLVSQRALKSLFPPSQPWRYKLSCDEHARDPISSPRACEALSRQSHSHGLF